MTQTGEPADEPPAQPERSPWQLSRDEQRALLITFVGGVAEMVGHPRVGVGRPTARGVEEGTLLMRSP